ncbi:hypothetical protein [uncultured Campylobacter sp.]|nr:hypothetical protein [uncultured Campylobacter sp.]
MEKTSRIEKLRYTASGDTCVLCVSKYSAEFSASTKIVQLAALHET